MHGLAVRDLKALKGIRQIAFVQVAREEEAIAAAEAGIDMIGTGFLAETRHFAQLVPQTHFQFGLKWGRHACATEALREAMEAMQCGAQSIYCAMSPSVIEVLAREGVPVIAHVGLVPPKATWTGGFRAVGKTAEQALKLWQQVREFENAGAFAVEIEVIPANLAAEITRRTSLLTISLGSGADCDAQYLFSADLLGENHGHFPRHAKAYRNFAAERDRLQAERVAAYREYVADIRSGAFPEARHLVAMNEVEFGSFIEALQTQA
ncbi:3-methyl-2-oxobutanoate hydroxymethyltransferase [Mesorhizobium sp. 131-2-1]|uniref:3-methyl-2-oxobutanoate hydroxymethyltransferase n=1 Tax=Mesorhizobium sp. 131-2-1 TaxID=2744518 RepID=UPI0018ECF9B0|nr:3-methyl-2-oxobutanoate hydroxymethyltransferase [Mesorhizobium sp. 131-2-1]BCG97836.1 3-methyl-2-oxobutanoate hydroxymethyltransferase [Mesorhizobium sp. 131-2-1]